MSKVTKSIYIDEELVERAEEMDDRNFSQLVEDLLRQYLEWSEAPSEDEHVENIRKSLEVALESVEQLEDKK